LRDPGGTLIVIEHLSAAVLGDLIIDKGQCEIGKWVERLGTARAVMEHFKPGVSPNRNGWSFWVLDDSSRKLLQSPRGAP
jgi:hypothetical protein